MTDEEFMNGPIKDWLKSKPKELSTEYVDVLPEQAFCLQYYSSAILNGTRYEMRPVHFPAFKCRESIFEMLDFCRATALRAYQNTLNELESHE